MHDDKNADLIGFEFVNRSEGGSRWRVTGTDAVLGGNYVDLRRVQADGSLDESKRGMRVQTAGSIRARKQIEQEGVAWVNDLRKAAA